MRTISFDGVIVGGGGAGKPGGLARLGWKLTKKGAKGAGGLAAQFRGMDADGLSLIHI